MRNRFLIALAVLSISVPALAEPIKRAFRSEQKFTLAPGGVLILENSVGSIDIRGGDVSGVEGTITKVITAIDEKAIEEGRKQTSVIVGGDQARRILRTNVIPNRPGPWAAAVHWNIRVPRSSNLAISSHSAPHTRIVSMTGNIHVKNFRGSVSLQEVTGSVIVHNTNGTILYVTSKAPAGNVVLSTVNGDVTAIVARDTDFRWVAETATGDIRTNLPARGAFFGTTFRGSVNAAGGPTITTSTLIGNIHLVRHGSSFKSAESLRTMAPSMVASQPQAGPPVGVLREQTVTGFFRYATSLGDVRIQEIKGGADIFTGAGEVQIGSVNGAIKVSSLGGPLQLGEVFGLLDASTRAGDILVDTARRGGSISTSGGTIRLLYTGGPTKLVSGGGDIIVRQAAGAIDARTSSGDVTITIDSKSHTERVGARTEGGSIVLNVPPGFGADVDATILTSDPTADTILSDVAGLRITRELESSGKTRVRAKGKLNGGGENVILRATSGDIRIATGGLRPTVVKTR